MRRPSTTRLVVAAAAVALVAGGAVAGAAVLDDEPRRPPETSLMGAVQGFLEAERPAGLTADLSLTTRLVETGGLADGSGILGGATGHIAIDGDGRARLDVETARGETRIGYDGGRLTVYDVPTNTVYGLDAPEWLRAQGVVADDEQAPGGEEADALTTVLGLGALLSQVQLTGPEPDNVAGQPAYRLRISPRRDAGLLGALELAWDAERGVPLRVAVFAAGRDEPVADLAVRSIEYGPVAAADLAVTPPAGAREVDLADELETWSASADEHFGGPAVEGLQAVRAAVPFALRAPDALVGLPRGTVRLLGNGRAASALTLYGRGLGQVVVWQEPASAPDSLAGDTELLPRVAIDGAAGWELATALGTVLRVEKDGVRYTLAGSVPAVAAEEAVRELLR
jgi:hypothetical protein